MIEAPPECPTCAALRRELRLVEGALAVSHQWADELRVERTEAQQRVRNQDAVLARLYADRADDRRLLEQQADWLAEYVGRWLAAEAALTRLRARPPRRHHKHKRKKG
jgi:hypothetical protein